MILCATQKYIRHVPHSPRSYHGRWECLLNFPNWIPWTYKEVPLLLRLLKRHSLLKFSVSPILELYPFPFLLLLSSESLYPSPILWCAFIFSFPLYSFSSFKDVFMEEGTIELGLCACVRSVIFILHWSCIFWPPVRHDHPGERDLIFHISVSPIIARMA